MARTKKYIEEEVIEKAMMLFWRNGYEATSTRMLEKEMGINQFSIYSSFKNKEGVFIESIRCYRNKLREISDKLRVAPNPVEGVRQYFIDFVGFSRENETQKGCLVINTFSELGKNSNSEIVKEAKKVADEILKLFKKNLALDQTKDEKTVEKQANFLIIAMTGVAAASKVFEKQQVFDFIENTFEGL